MASLFENVIHRYENWLLHDQYADPRTKHWYLIGNPATLFSLLACYVYFCTKAGPRLMKNREPYQLKNTLIVYNILQVLLSSYVTYEGFQIWRHYNFFCQPMDFLISPFSKRMLDVSWMYFFAKITELLDTIFFVLRKKYSQISFLHLFHHTLMPFASWVNIRYFAGGHGTLLGVINSFVHIVMYTYYLIAGLGPQYQKYLWWKKHLTALQLIQFVIVFLHNFIPLFISDCDYPKILHVLLVIFTGLFIYMFGKFYVQNYIKKLKTSLNKTH